jgi:single-strand selective monofunctional uracil DNA glycosylase
MSIADKIIDELHLLNSRLKKLHFDEPVAYIYNPLEYASEPLENYFRKYAVGGHKKILFLGMNPGPFGMMQTGVPFGEINAVKNWLEIDVNALCDRFFMRTTDFVVEIGKELAD